MLAGPTTNNNNKRSQIEDERAHKKLKSDPHEITLPINIPVHAVWLKNFFQIEPLPHVLLQAALAGRLSEIDENKALADFYKTQLYALAAANGHQKALSKLSEHGIFLALYLSIQQGNISNAEFILQAYPKFTSKIVDTTILDPFVHKDSTAVLLQFIVDQRIADFMYGPVACHLAFNQENYPAFEAFCSMIPINIGSGLIGFYLSQAVKIPNLTETQLRIIKLFLEYIQINHKNPNWQWCIDVTGKAEPAIKDKLYIKALRDTFFKRTLEAGRELHDPSIFCALDDIKAAYDVEWELEKAQELTQQAAELAEITKSSISPLQRYNRLFQERMEANTPQPPSALTEQASRPLVFTPHVSTPWPLSARPVTEPLLSGSRLLSVSPLLSGPPILSGPSLLSGARPLSGQPAISPTTVSQLLAGQSSAAESPAAQNPNQRPGTSNK